MSVTEEAGGRLNAFAKEPKIEVIDKDTRHSNGFWLIIIAGGLLLVGLIGFSISIS